MARKTSPTPPVFVQVMQEGFGRATREAAARAELAGVPLAGAKSDPVKKLTPKKTAPRKVMAASAGRARARKKA
ncbi:MAG TPA: hypothetical protein VG735_02860 [Caulobacterales bacterium]|nr:hypothetical protein [Caulobacterales bacterium]